MAKYGQVLFLKLGKLGKLDKIKHSVNVTLFQLFHVIVIHNSIILMRNI